MPGCRDAPERHSFQIGTPLEDDAVANAAQAGLHIFSNSEIQWFRRAIVKGRAGDQAGIKYKEQFEDEKLEGRSAGGYQPRVQ